MFLMEIGVMALSFYIHFEFKLTLICYEILHTDTCFYY